MGRFSHRYPRIVGWARSLGRGLFYLPLRFRLALRGLGRRAKRQREELAAWTQVQRRRPFCPVPYRRLIALHSSAHNHEEVARLCEDLSLLGYGSSTLAKKHAFALCHLERFQDAIQVLEQASAGERPDPWILECLGNCYFTVAEYRPARRSYLRCLELRPRPEVQARIMELIRQIEVLLGYGKGPPEGR